MSHRTVKPPLVIPEEVLYVLGGIQNPDKEDRSTFATSFFNGLTAQVENDLLTSTINNTNHNDLNRNNLEPSDLPQLESNHNNNNASTKNKNNIINHKHYSNISNSNNNNNDDNLNPNPNINLSLNNNNVSRSISRSTSHSGSQSTEIDNYNDNYNEYLSTPRNNNDNNNSGNIIKYSSSEEIEFYEDSDFFDVIFRRPLSQNLYVFLPCIIDLQYTCPWKDVAKFCCEFLTLLETTLNIDIDTYLHYIPSVYINNPEHFKLPPKCTGELQQIYQFYFSKIPRISNLDMLLSILPKPIYYDHNRELFFSLMCDENNGPLNHQWKQYLALMAASRYDCEPLITLLETQFSLIGTAQSWIKSGLSAAPPKLSKIAKLNALLAHQPWKITPQHISDLVNGKNPWTVSEIVQAMVIFVCYHLLCGLYHGFCLPPELDLHFYRKFSEDFDAKRDPTVEQFNSQQTQQQQQSSHSSYSSKLNSSQSKPPLHSKPQTQSSRYDIFIDVLKETFAKNKKQQSLSHGSHRMHKFSNGDDSKFNNDDNNNNNYLKPQFPNDLASDISLSIQSMDINNNINKNIKQSEFITSSQTFPNTANISLEPSYGLLSEDFTNMSSQDLNLPPSNSEQINTLSEKQKQIQIQIKSNQIIQHQTQTQYQSSDTELMEKLAGLENTIDTMIEELQLEAPDEKVENDKEETQTTNDLVKMLSQDPKILSAAVTMDADVIGDAFDIAGDLGVEARPLTSPDAEAIEKQSNKEGSDGNLFQFPFKVRLQRMQIEEDSEDTTMEYDPDLYPPNSKNSFTSSPITPITPTMPKIPILPESYINGQEMSTVAAKNKDSNTNNININFEISSIPENKSSLVKMNGHSTNIDNKQELEEKRKGKEPKMLSNGYSVTNLDEKKEDEKVIEKKQRIHNYSHTSSHSHSSSTHQTPLLTSENWEQIVRLRKQNVLRMQSDGSSKGLNNRSSPKTSIASIDNKNVNLNSNLNNLNVNLNGNFSANRNQNLNQTSNIMPKILLSQNDTNNNNNNNNNENENENETEIDRKQYREIQGDVPLILQDKAAAALIKVVNKRGPLGRTKKKHRKTIMTKVPSSCGVLYTKYSGGISMCYEDFDCHKNPQIHLYDFNWKEHGFSILSRYYPGIEKKLDIVFNTTQTMTDDSICGQPVGNTEIFRNAVWHYAFRLYGINDDSYDYKAVNYILKKKLKIFVKKIVCYPQSVTWTDIRRIGMKLLEHEKLHVAILALQAKQQAALLFGLSAVMKYMSSCS